jgi:hypothetical protein
MPAIPAEIVHILTAKKCVIGAIFFGKFRCFSWNRNQSEIKGLCGTPSWFSGKTPCFYRHSWQQK